MFIGMWNFADDQGNLDRSAKQIKARVFPNDTIDCEPLLQELLAVRLLTEYEVDGRKYLSISNFHRHQKIDRPSAPVCPQPSTRRALDDDSTSTRPRKGGDRSGEESNGGEGKAGGNFGEYVACLKECYPDRYDPDTPKVHRALFELEKTLPPVAQLRASIVLWAGSVEWSEKGGRFIPSPENFIRGEKWKTKPASSTATTNGDHAAEKLKTKIYTTRRLYEMEIAKTLPKGDERIYGVRKALERAETLAQLDEVRTTWLPAS